MVKKCCVLHCKSNNARSTEKGHVTCFKFPTERSLREAWLRKIPRKGLIVTEYTVVCIKHFHDRDLIKYDILPGRDGYHDILVPRKKIALRKDAVPCIFPKLRSHLPISSGPARRASTRRNKIEEAHGSSREERLNEDKINSFEEFFNDVDRKMNTFKRSALIQKSPEEVLLYSLVVPSFEQHPFLKFSVRVCRFLQADIWLNDINQGSLHLTGGTLEYWSQLEYLLSYVLYEEIDAISDISLLEQASSIISKVSTTVSVQHLFK